jgi:hypothetical protein
MLSGREIACEADGKSLGNEIDFDFLLLKKKVLLVLCVLIPEWILEIVLEGHGIGKR